LHLFAIDDFLAAHEREHLRERHARIAPLPTRPRAAAAASIASMTRCGARGA